MATSFNRFYTTELARLRANSLEFAQNNPTIAPMLAGVSTDPDVERLLEGALIKAGTEIGSTPVEDVSCKFRTTADVHARACWSVSGHGGGLQGSERLARPSGEQLGGQSRRPGPRARKPKVAGTPGHACA